MKRKYILMIVVGVFILLFIFRYRILYKTSRLICVGEIAINENLRPIGFDGFCWVNRDDFEKELNYLHEISNGWIVLSQQEKKELIDAVNQYENYQTVIFSKINSSELWTRRVEPHIGYMNLHQIIGDGKTTYDDVIYVYVTKCMEIDAEPDDWQWRNSFY